jgi:hypothetical protein
MWRFKMRNQRGISTQGIVVAVIAALVIGVLFMMYVSASNYGNRTEQNITANYDNNENIYAMGTQKVMEIAQVPGMYADDLKKVVTAAVQGTYGPNGSQATVQFLKERDVRLDPSMYTKIQQVIEGFRNEFQHAQTGQITMCKEYKISLGNFWQGKMLSFAGKPSIDLEKYCKPVTTDKARQTFETKRDSGIQLRPSN